MKLEIIEASYHRNGIVGEGFYAILFSDAAQKGVMVASLFDAPYYCAVYSVDELAAGNITFAQGNSWRGDRYEAELRPLLKRYLNTQGTNRMEPFALPGAKPKGDATNSKSYPEGGDEKALRRKYPDAQGGAGGTGP